MFDTDSGMEERDTQIEAIRTGLEGALARFAISAARRSARGRRASVALRHDSRASLQQYRGRQISLRLLGESWSPAAERTQDTSLVHNTIVDQYARHSLKYPHCASGGVLT